MSSEGFLDIEEQTVDFGPRLFALDSPMKRHGRRLKTFSEATRRTR
jgi:hypothetical protein